MDLKTISSKTVYQIEINKSKFIAVAFPIQDEQMVKDYLKAIKKEYPKADHYCYGYVLEESTMRSSDAGEPNGTAGVPIMLSIQRMGFSKVLIIVIRYFGGTLLGASGLTKAYREAAEGVLKNATPEIHGWREHFNIEAPIELTSVLDYWLQTHKVNIVERTFENDKTNYLIYVNDSAIISSLINQMNGKILVTPKGINFLLIKQ